MVAQFYLAVAVNMVSDGLCTLCCTGLYNITDLVLYPCEMGKAQDNVGKYWEPEERRVTLCVADRSDCIRATRPFHSSCVCPKQDC